MLWAVNSQEAGTAVLGKSGFENNEVQGGSIVARQLNWPLVWSMVHRPQRSVYWSSSSSSL